MSKSTKKRPAWLAEGQAREKGGRADPDADTGEIPAVERAAGEKDTATQVLDPPARDTGGASPGGTAGADDAPAARPAPPSDKPSGLRTIREALGALPQRTRRWLLLAGMVVVVVLVLFSGYRLLIEGPSEGQGATTGTSGAASGAPADPALRASGVQDTGAVFGALKAEDGSASLEGAGLSWQGEVEEGETGRTITLKGPTAVQIREGFEMPASSITSGVYAVAQGGAQGGAGGEVLHVTFHTFEADDTEVTQASIFAVREDSLEFSGYYRDERQDGSEKVVRTYMPPGGGNYRVSFEAPPGTPIPLLVGFGGTS